MPTPPEDPIDPIDELQARVRELVLERQRLLDTGAAPADLDRNRRAIVAANQDLSRALIARYRPAA
jgi:hypothetical protein